MYHPTWKIRKVKRLFYSYGYCITYSCKSESRYHMQSVQSGTKKNDNKKALPQFWALKGAHLLYFPQQHAKAILFLFFSAMGPYRERSNPKTSAPVFAVRHLGSLWSRTGSFCFLLQCKSFFILLVYFNSQILLIVVRVRGIMHVWFLESDIYFQNILTLVEHNQALMRKGSQCEINGIPSDVQRIFFCILNKSHVLVLKSSLWKGKLRLILM